MRAVVNQRLIRSNTALLVGVAHFLLYIAALTMCSRTYPIIRDVTVLTSYGGDAFQHILLPNENSNTDLSQPCGRPSFLGHDFRGHQKETSTAPHETLVDLYPDKCASSCTLRVVFHDGVVVLV